MQFEEFEPWSPTRSTPCRSEFQKVLEEVAVIVSDLGTEHHAYGITSATASPANATRTGS